jgi:hypothetical protein
VGQLGEPLEQLVAEEAQLASSGETVTRHPPLPDHLAQVLDVDLEELGRERGGEDWWEFLGRGGPFDHRASVRGAVLYAKRIPDQPT